MRGHRQWGQAGLNIFLRQKVAMEPSGGRARSPRRKSRAAAALGPGAFLLRLAGRIAGFGRARLKFAGAAF